MSPSPSSPAATAPAACWSCKAGLAAADAFCPSCRKLQPPHAGADHFAVLGVPRRYALDPVELEQRFRELSRQFHPDRFARAEPRERRWSLERTTRLNDAFRTLKDDRLRAEYLLRLGGHDPQAKSLTDLEFLEEQLEHREALQAAREEGDLEAQAAIGARARERLEELRGEVAVLFAEQERGADRHLAIAKRLARARYYVHLAEDAEGTMKRGVHG